MTLSDPIADMLTRIRNAGAAGLPDVKIPHSRLKEEMARILKSEGFVRDFRVDREGSFPVIVLTLKYKANEEPVIQGLERVSRPGLRQYTKADEVPRVLGGIGIAILSTSKGIVTDKEARQAKLGGEILCHVW